jgi:hypothetical protein
MFGPDRRVSARSHYLPTEPDRFQIRIRLGKSGGAKVNVAETTTFVSGAVKFPDDRVAGDPVGAESAEPSDSFEALATTSAQLRFSRSTSGGTRPGGPPTRRASFPRAALLLPDERRVTRTPSIAVSQSGAKEVPVSHRGLDGTG